MSKQIGGLSYRNPAKSLSPNSYVAFTSYLFGKKKSQLFNQLLEDILIAKLEPWHHLQAYGVLFLMNTRQKKRERERLQLWHLLLFLVHLEVR